jgi:hypothetical protein
VSAANETVITRLVRNCALERVIQYSRDLCWSREAAAYWIPARASMTAVRLANGQSFAESFFIAGLIGAAAFSYPSHALLLPSSAGTVRTV